MLEAAIVLEVVLETMPGRDRRRSRGSSSECVACADREPIHSTPARPAPRWRNHCAECQICADRHMSSLRVLVVEDEAMIALLLGTLLAEMGHEVCATADTAAAAIDAARRYAPDLIIADAHLHGGEDGVDAVEEILRMRRRCLTCSSAAIRRQ